LAYEATYGWYVVAFDGEYFTSSDTWAFTTRGESPPGGMYIWDISWREKTAGPNTFLYYTATVRWDSDGSGTAEESDELVSDATVFSTLSQNGTSNIWEFSGGTDSSGNVEFGSKVSSGDFMAEITNVIHSAYEYTPELNVINPGYHTVN
jgi:hypothetical protein